MTETPSSGNPPADDVAPKGMPPRSAEPELAASFLLRAMRAVTNDERERLANQGLTRPDAEDPEMRALLLRQLYTSFVERGDYRSALHTAEEMVDLESLGDIARQDAARAAMGLGEFVAAAGHLRIAARVCPPNRRSFHLATLGALQRFDGHPEDAVETFTRAVRWATADRSLYLAQLVLAQRDAGRPLSFDLQELREKLEGGESLKGYALWVLGELCGLLGDDEAARDYLTRFVARMTEAPRAKTLSLAGELAHAEALLAALSA